MKRINLIYGGISYSVAERELAYKDEIAKAVTRGTPYWLQVNNGEGTPEQAHLLITPGTDLALLPISAPEPPIELTINTPPPPPAR